MSRDRRAIAHPSITGGREPAVELRDVAQRLAGHWALRGVTLRVEPGEIVAVVGHNGSGKTTLLRVIATLLRPTRGEGRVLGHDLRRDSDGVRGAIGMLGHASGLYDDLTAEENLAFALRMLGRAPEPARIATALRAVGLRRGTGVRVRAFSSGMQRRVSLARLLLRRAPVLLLDEPYNSFDDDGVALVDALLGQTRAQGGAALVVVHDMARGAAAFDRVIELRDGLIAPRDDDAPLPRETTSAGADRSVVGELAEALP